MISRLILVAMCSTIVGCGVSNSQVYQGTGTTPDLRESGIEVLGEVTACQGGFCHGQWPMSLAVPPPAMTYQAAIRKEAAKQYHVPESEIVIGEMTVGYYSELNGVIRGWTTTALVGRKIGNTAQTPPTNPTFKNPNNLASPYYSP